MGTSSLARARTCPPSVRFLLQLLPFQVSRSPRPLDLVLEPGRFLPSFLPSISRFPGLPLPSTELWMSIPVSSQVRSHWPMGLGRYLLMKFEETMLAKGVLQVDKISSKAGNFVFVNGRTVGLSNKLNDFEGLAVRMVKYEAVLAKLTAKLAGKVSRFNKKHVAYVKPPQWGGN